MDTTTLTFEDALQIAHRCKGYSVPKEYNNGGHYETFQHAIETVINVLNFVKFSGIKPSQIARLYAIGAGETPAEEKPSKPTVLNVNSTVRVKLTDYGRAVHAKDYANFCASSGVTRPYTAPEEDAEGRSTWQFWHLLQTFSPYIGTGFTGVFEADIEVVE